MKKILLIDNYDSFTYNLVHAIEEIVGHNIDIKKNDQIDLKKVQSYEYIILSPGPGLPDESGLLKPIIDQFKSTKKILGICLGLQAIGEVYGCPLKNLEKVYHGIRSEITQTSDESILFKGIDNPFKAGRYHSWVVDEESIVEDLIVTSKDANGQIMSLEHKTDSVYAVQFHPESIMTEQGKVMLSNFLNL